MADIIDTRPKYAIALVLDDSVKLANLSKLQSIVSKINSLTLVKNLESTSDFVISGVTPEIRLKLYAIVGRKTPVSLKRSIQLPNEEGAIVPGISIIWSGEDYTYSQLQMKLRQWIGQMGALKLEAELRSSLAPSSSTVFLQIYNQISQLWETVDSDSSANADTDFTLTASIPDLTDYKVGGNYIVCRVFQLDV